jgi:hypothetical protein
MEVSRRRIIKLGLAGSTLLGMGGIGLFLRPTVFSKASRPLLALNEKTFSILAATAERIIPRGKKFPRPGDIQVAEKIDDLLAVLHPADVMDFNNGLMLMENALAGFVFDGRWSSFTGGSEEVQDKVLDDFRTSRLETRRAIYRAIYGMVSAAYWASPETYAAAGYDGPPEFGSGLATKPSRPPIKRRGIEPPGPLEPVPEPEEVQP